MEISVRGHSLDERANEIFTVKQTICKKKTAMHVKFSLECRFSFKVPEIAFIIFRVYDKEMKNQNLMGQMAVPVEAIQPGYRTIPIPLLGTSSRVSYCKLFVFVEIDDC